MTKVDCIPEFKGNQGNQCLLRGIMLQFKKLPFIKDIFREFRIVQSIKTKYSAISI